MALNTCLEEYMREPLFEIQEEVIVCNPFNPELNGERVVLGSITLEVFTKLYPTFAPNGSNYFYDLGVTFFGNRSGAICHYVGEKRLRKKHKPSDDSFEDMMSKLKIGETV